MSSYQFTPRAVEDLFEIWSYIASDDLDAANRVEEAIHDACATMADTPLAGRVREDLTALPLRFRIVLPHRNYWLVCTTQQQSRCGSSGLSRRREIFGRY
jgi:antitoxin ParD1/3/4